MALRRAAKAASIAVLAAGALLAGAPRIEYSKSFPGSVPPWVGIVVESNGDGVYKDSPEDESPLKFKLTDAEVKEIFALAEKLDYFKRPLESQLKVAFMGMKTFKWVGESQTSEVKFNFSEDVTARAIADWFERISESESHFINLQRAAKYDKLGVLKALLQLETAMDRKRLVSMSQYLPLLDRIVKNESYMHAARVRAAGIADAIRGPAAAAAAAAESAPSAAPAPATAPPQ
jgi:hypothetical protein